MRQPALALVALLAGLPIPAPARAGSPAEACFERTTPQPDSIRAIRMTARDRSGQKPVVVMQLYGRRNAQGLGQLFIRLLEPDSVRGASLLVLEQPGGASDIYLATPELPTPRRITGPARTDGMFRTDFSSEDLERLQQGWRPGAGEMKQLPDESIGGRPVYVLEIRPRDSAYERVVLSIDHESCLPLLVRFYEHGKSSPRKELTTDPRSNLKHGSLWVAHEALMRDLEKLSTTHLMVDSHAQEQLLPDGQFTVDALARSVQGEAKAAP